MQAKGQAVRSDALARYGVQIGQKLRHVDYAASGLGKFFAGVLSSLTVSEARPSLHACTGSPDRGGVRRSRPARQLPPRSARP